MSNHYKRLSAAVTPEDIIRFKSDRRRLKLETEITGD